MYSKVIVYRMYGYSYIIPTYSLHTDGIPKKTVL